MVKKSIGQQVGHAFHVVHDGNVLEDAYQALISVGLNPQEARNRLDKVMAMAQEEGKDKWEEMNKDLATVAAHLGKTAG